MRSTLSLLVLAACLVGASCVASRPIRYYTIDLARSPAVQGRPDGLVLLIGNIAAGEALRDDRIRFRSGPNQSGVYEYHRWAERPGSLVRTSLLQALRASGKYRRVLESGSLVTGDYLLTGKLREFGEVDGASIHTRISLQVELIDRKTNSNVWDHTTDRDEPVSGKTVPDVVQSLDRNLQEVVRQTAAEIDAFLGTRRP